MGCQSLRSVPWATSASLKAQLPSSVCGRSRWLRGVRGQKGWNFRGRCSVPQSCPVVTCTADVVIILDFFLKKALSSPVPSGDWTRTTKEGQPELHVSTPSNGQGRMTCHLHPCISYKTNSSSGYCYILSVFQIDEGLV